MAGDGMKWLDIACNGLNGWKWWLYMVVSD